jgi:rhodanese-related sulfurtransferase
MRWKQVVKEAALLAAVSICLAGIYNFMAPKERSLAWVGHYSAGDARPQTAIPEGSAGSPATVGSKEIHSIAPPKDPGLLYLEVGGDVAQRLQAAGALIVDARRSDEYERGHIPGARSIAIWERDADEKIGALQKEALPFDQVIVVYCSGGDCQDSKIFSEKLALTGFYNIYVYKDGFPDWEQRGLPVHKGKTP